MGVLHYALNHTRKEAFILDKTISNYGFAPDKRPKTYEEMYAYVWSEMDPETNFVDAEWGTPENAERIAKMLWEFGVEDGVSDSNDIIEEQYHDYKYVGSIYENDTQIGELMCMRPRYDTKQPGEPMTMVVNTENGYERRNVEYKRVEMDYSYRPPLRITTCIPTMAPNEQMFEGASVVCGMRIPMIVKQ